MGRIAFILVGFLAVACAQVTAPKSIMGTVTAFRPATLEMEVKPDTGDAVAVTFNEETQVQRIAPGARNLTGATAIKITDVAMGDRVLVSFATGTHQARRIVVMSANEIAKRNEADREDWTKRGLSGIVVSKAGAQVTIKMRSMSGETQATVTVDDKTKFRRYSPDSVRFADAHDSKLAEVAVGDQLRARGKKSEDGSKVEAEEVVFGTFLTKAGTVTSVNLEAKQILVKDLVTNKPLTIHLTADSQLKAMPDFAAMMGARMGQGGGAGGASAAAPGAPAGARGGAGGRGFDLAQMMERLPAAKLEDLKPGQTLLVSSTKGATSDQVTAITLLSNADFLIQMASSRGSGANRGGGGMGGAMGGGMGMGGLSGGLEGLGMSGMIP